MWKFLFWIKLQLNRIKLLLIAGLPKNNIGEIKSTHLKK